MVEPCGLVKIEDYLGKKSNLVVTTIGKGQSVAYEEDDMYHSYVDLSAEFYDRNDSTVLNRDEMNRHDIEYYKQYGTVMSLEIHIYSHLTEFENLHNHVYPVLREIMLKDYHVATIDFFYDNHLTGDITHVEDVSGDYILLVVPCTSVNESTKAQAWLQQSLRAIIGNMSRQFGNNISVEDALKMLE